MTTSSIEIRYGRQGTFGTSKKGQCAVLAEKMARTELWIDPLGELPKLYDKQYQHVDAVKNKGDLTC